MDLMIDLLAKELGQAPQHIQNVITLLDEGNTIPFIARYRKELHGSMDDTILRTFFDRLQYLRNLAQRRTEVKSSIDGQGKLTETLSASIDSATTLAEVEDLYRPYKQKRRTRATIARERGLAPLADILFAQERNCPLPQLLAQDYINPEQDVHTIEDALAGANDIIAEEISDNADLRKQLRELFLRRGMMSSKAAEKEPDPDSVYRLYYEFKSTVARTQGYQSLAINRGEREGVLKASVELDRDTALVTVRRAVIRPGAPSMEFVKAAADDAWDRLISPSVEREIRNHLTELASEGAIRTFALNLKPLLMQPPIRSTVTMALDPGFRMGCKVAVVDGTGKVLDTTVVYPTYGNRQKEECIVTLFKMVKAHNVCHIAIGNGTASRETEQMTVELIQKVGGGLSYMMVNEAGASVYSASALAAEEFPEYDVNIRSAISIARRLQDPLAELVKIDPKAIGVGQYQHDMPQARLSTALDGVVEDCVNGVGVDINTASSALLSRVAGLNATTAKNVVKFREENGVFTTRKQLLKVPKLGPKAFLQCAGFLRVPESKSILDRTAVHPESYPAAEALLTACGYTLANVADGTIAELMEKINEVGKETLATTCSIGVPTLLDVASELLKPGRDPRDELPAPILRTDVLDVKDLKAGMELCGTVRNVIDFGAFVDIGVHQDGLVHVSKFPRRVEHPSHLLTVGDVITVWVDSIDEKRKRIALTMLKPE